MATMTAVDSKILLSYQHVTALVMAQMKEVWEKGRVSYKVCRQSYTRCHLDMEGGLKH